MPADRETFELNGLGKYQIDQALILQEFKEPDGSELEGDFLKRAQVAADWPLGVSGDLSFISKKREISRFIEKITAQNMGRSCSAVHVDCQVGDYLLQGHLNNIFENGILIARYGKLRGRDLLSAWLHHLVMLTHQEGTDHRTCLVTSEKTYTFSLDSKGPDLTSMLDFFCEGQVKPSKLFIEPAFSYAKQLRGRGKIPPLEKAKASLLESLEKGYEPEWQLLLQGVSEDHLLGQEFEAAVVELMVPILEGADG